MIVGMYIWKVSIDGNRVENGGNKIEFLDLCPAGSRQCLCKSMQRYIIINPGGHSSLRSQFMVFPTSPR